MTSSVTVTPIPELVDEGAVTESLAGYLPTAIPAGFTLSVMLAGAVPFEGLAVSHGWFKEVDQSLHPFVMLNVCVGGGGSPVFAMKILAVVSALSVHGGCATSRVTATVCGPLLAP